jgi:RNA polymerase sigma factor (sigma-70 family)
MPQPVLETLNHYCRSLAGRSVAEWSDRELLTRFAKSRDESAFAVLLDRHGAMVRGVCRRALGEAHKADDVCQAVFLVLARKAGSLRRGEQLANWLFGVARRLAARANRQQARRQQHERSAAMQKKRRECLTAPAWDDLLAVLEEELARLPARFRAPLLACYYRGQTQDEAAKELGWSERTLRRRLAEGRDLLRKRLERRGATLTAGLFAAALLPSGVDAALPAALRDATLATVLGDAPAAPVRELVRGGLQMLSLSKVRTWAGIGLVAAAVLAAGGLIWREQTPPLAAQPAEPPPAAKAETPRAEEAQAATSMRVAVLDPQGKPLPGANIHVGIWTNEKGFKANRDYQTDAAGAAQVELPKSYYIVRLWASKKPFISMFANWEQDELASGKGVPAEHTFRLETAVTAGGRVVDEDGKPIAGAKVEVMIDSRLEPKLGDGRVHYNTWLATGDEAVTTDADGRWRIDNVPNHPQVQLNLLITHPDFASDNSWQQTQKASGVTSEQLRKGTATLTLKAGVIVQGQVTDPAGKPIKDAIVIHGDRPYFSWLPCKFATDAEGKFRLPAVAPGQTTLTVMAPGFAPQMRRLNLQAGLSPQDFRMQAGKPIRLRIVDSHGRPVPKAYVTIARWKGSESIQSDHNPNHPKVPDTKIPRQAGEDGVWEWRSAPDEAVKLHVYFKGSAPVELEVAGGAPERKVTLKAEHRITGRVTDAVTGKPIPSFTVIPVDVFRKDWLVAARFNAVAGKDGRFDFRADRTDIPLRVRVEAMGYRSQDGPEFRVGDDSRTQDFRLQPSAPITGIVVDADDKPVANAQVVMATATEQAELSSDWGGHKTTTDAAGRFSFPDPGEPFALVVRGAGGFAQAELAADRKDAGTLQLRPWASVRGQYRDGGKPVAGATIFLQPVRIDALDRPRINAISQVVTGADGGFEFSRVPPGPVIVSVHIGPWKDEGIRSGPRVPLDLKPGEKGELNLGSGGPNVSGKVKLTGSVPSDLECTYSLNYLIRREPGISPPPEIAKLGFDIRKGWRERWQKTQEGLAYQNTLRHWFVKLAPDGSFRISGVPPGEYDLAIAVYAKPDG